MHKTRESLDKQQEALYLADREKLEIVKKCFHDVIWMAIRYAHGRHTYAPSMVREAVMKMEEIFPDFKLKPDITIEPPNEENLDRAFSLRSDYLDDLFTEK